MALSELQISLIGAGALAVAIVWGYNVWQERKHRKTAEKLLRSDQPDALLDEPAESLPRPVAGMKPGQFSAPAEYTEPRIEPRMVAAVVPEPQQEPRPQRTDLSSAAVSPESRPAPDTGLPAQWADPAVDCVLCFSVDAGIPASTVFSMQMEWSPLLTKPLRWLGRADATSGWVLVDAESSVSYGEWVAALQLADRRGAATDGDLGRFMDGVAQIAAQAGAAVELPVRGDVLMRAAALDEFCASVDIQFSVHIVEASGGVFIGTRLRGVAEAGGLSLGTDGRFHARDTAGSELFSLANMGQERFDPESLKSLSAPGLTLTLDVPRCVDGAAAFDQMLSAGRQMTRVLGGVLVDAQRVPLAEAMITGIRAKTIELQQSMRNAGIEPGGTRALRLFA